MFIFPPQKNNLEIIIIACRPRKAMLPWPHAG
jgi:hypothetical protein